MLKQYYYDRFGEIIDEPLEPGDGLGDAAVRTALAARGLTIPTALSDFYSLAGRHWINENHDLLLPIEKLEWMGDKLVFMEENQAVCFWGIDRADLNEADPIVWRANNEEPIRWRSENRRLSRFLMALWKWNMTGESGDAGPDEDENEAQAVTDA
jgi:hypothetical protein